MQQIMQLKNKAVQILDLAKKSGATAGELVISYGDGLNVDVRNQSLETLEFQQNQNLSLTLYVNQSKGTASVTNLDDKTSLKQAIDSALNFAKYTKPDVYAGLADAHLMAQEVRDFDLYHPHNINADDAIKLALTCEEAAFAEDKNIAQGNGTSFSHAQNMFVYANSHGFIGAEKQTSYSLSCSMIAGSGDDMQTDFDYDFKLNFNDLADAKQIGIKAAKKCVAKLNARKTPTTKACVLFAPQTAKSLVKTLLAGLNGYNLYKKSSFLVDTLGEQILPNWLNVNEDPHILRTSASSSFDGDGLATYAKPIIAQGVVQNYVLDTYSARRLGLNSTANSGSVHNILLSANAGSQQDIIANITRGLLVTDFMGHGINLLNGDYSRGVSGFWIENGQITFPVSEVTIAGNLRDMFKQIIAVGKDVDYRSYIYVGSILLDNMTIAGN